MSVRRLLTKISDKLSGKPAKFVEPWMISLPIKTGKEYHLRLSGGNGEITWTTETFSTKQACMAARDRFMDHVRTGNFVVEEPWQA